MTEEIVECLRWFVQEDDTRDMKSNGFWVVGLERARKALADFDGEVYEPLPWENQEPSVMDAICNIERGEKK